MYPTHSPLLSLPPELRNQILETLFFGDQLSTLCKCRRPNPFQRMNYGVLGANKQLHREASNILFHGGALRLDVPMDYPPSLVTKTVIPIWSWFVRDRYRDNGTDLEFLQRWQGLKHVRHVEMSLPSNDEIGWLAVNPGFGSYLEACEKAAGFLNGLPEVESLTVWNDADGSRWMEKCKETLGAVTNAKLHLVVLAKCDGCGHQL